MLITLSEERNEKLLCEWSSEMTEEHMQDFCDVCTEIFVPRFTLDYMYKKYIDNMYGESFIVVVYKDDIPSAAIGVWRNDLDNKPAFQLVDFASLVSVRKNGYALDMLYCIFDEVRTKYPGAVIYAMPGPMSYPIYKAIGFACKEMYTHIYHGITRDFLESMPYIDDAYVEKFMLKKKHVDLKQAGGKCYLVLRRTIAGRIPAGLFLGEISSKYRERFSRLRQPRILFYRSEVPGILGSKRTGHVVQYDPCAEEQIMVKVPPRYKEDSMSLDFND